jgi:hypothetical protein
MGASLGRSIRFSAGSLRKQDWSVDEKKAKKQVGRMRMRGLGFFARTSLEGSRKV